MANEIDPWNLLAGTVLPVGVGSSVVLPDFDFETYSEAGYEFIEGAGRSKLGAWKKIKGVSSNATNPLAAVGAPVYAEHPSTEVLSLAYNLKDGQGVRLWIPGMEPPVELFNHVIGGGLLEAHNSGFEWYVWNLHCVPRLGWPPLPLHQLRCSMAKCRHFSIMASLEDAGTVLQLETQKQATEGKRLLGKFSGPRAPTKTDRRLRIRPEEDHVDAWGLYQYNIFDTYAESGVSACVPDMPADELELWLLDQKINTTGVQIDMDSARVCMRVLEQATVKGNAEVKQLTDGRVSTVGQVSEIRAQLAAWGVVLPNMAKETTEPTWENWDDWHGDAPPQARRLMELRMLLGSASVKKVYALGVKTSRDGRLRDIFSFCGADRTGRWSGRGVQPQNLPNSGPKVRRCEDMTCHHHYGKHLTACPWCGADGSFSEVVEWSVDAVDEALLLMRHNSDLAYLEHFFGDTVAIIGGCLRGLFCAAPGHDLVCSDYSAIEAVVLACLAGEQWRIDVFNSHGKIYEMSASKITGVSFDDMMRHKEETGEHHPLRKKIGKVAELASGYQGSIGAWRAFGADKFLGSDEEILEAVRAWRKASPEIVKFWYALQDAAHNAVKHPGQYFEVRGLVYCVKGGVLYCRLLSGRLLKYHGPQIVAGDRGPKLCYWGRKSETNKWTFLDTYGGKLCENIVQATARDIMAHAMINVDKAGYPIVLHVHDELVVEVPEGTGAIAEFETIMATLPAWCAHWPIRAAGGWRGKRYRKD